MHVELTAAAAPTRGPFALTSTAFDNGNIPIKYTCAGDGGAGNDISPPLAWATGHRRHAELRASRSSTLPTAASTGRSGTSRRGTSLPEGLSAGFNVPDVAGAKQKAMGSGD